MCWQSALAICNDSCRCRCFFPSDDKGEWLSGNWNHRHFLYLWNFVDYFFHIPREGRFLLKLGWVPHIGLARDNAEISLFIHLCNITGQKPALLCDDLLCDFGVFPISHHHLRTANSQLTNLALFHFFTALSKLNNFCFCGWKRYTNRPNLAFFSKRIRVRNWRCFCKPVSFNKSALRQLLECLLYLNRQWSGTADASLDGFDSIFAHAAKIIDGNIHAWHTRENSRLVGLNRFEHIQHLELRLQNHCRTKGDRRVERSRQAITMKERNHT